MTAEPAPSGVVEIAMPRLGDTVLEGTILSWLRQPGDRVAAGDLIAEISSDKVTTEYPAEQAGTLVELLVPAGATVPVGAAIARLALDATAVTAVAPAPAVPAAATAVAPALSLTRRVIARRMEEVWASAAAAALFGLAEVDELVAFQRRQRADFRQAHGRDLTLLPLLVQAVARATRVHAGVNCLVESGGLRPAVGVGIGVAVAIADGVVVPVTRDPDQRPWPAVALELAVLAERGRAGRLGAEETRGGSTTVTNVGAFGAEWSLPMLHPGQATIIGLGVVRSRPVALPGGGIGWRQTCPISVAYDRRLLETATVARFLDTLALVCAAPPPDG